ncbi:MAG: TIGR00730 family Rossman fold protein [Myxococcota bacterium]|nr:TIGR00730 family Rossman fold protein [bacterium]MDP6074437.1 TIGR00730 family Rossman fold protein [Myxococcota bacterium]MDP6244156.1 TIGR00730 family Rossman fold protein [Myxococcota bacterium]MDP7073822.1 TIGR00730 family Rossman fold protein [Myxococcota bacterium]MDP7300334.1 TIGR00730 family Rossman fold protein [Myxococcota bacterium]
MKIAVFCGSSRHCDPRFLEPARQLGAEISLRGHVLVYGGGRSGLMGAVADTALAQKGRVEGVIPRNFMGEGAHHLALDELQVVDDMRARKAAMDARAQAFIALPGGCGTLEELTEILSFRKLGLHHRLLVLLDTDGFFDGLAVQINRAVAEGFDSTKSLDYFRVARDARDAVDLCEGSIRD